MKLALSKSRLASNPGGAIKATLYDKLNYNFIRDIAAIGGHRDAWMFSVMPIRDRRR